jgi:hypothetical protein
MSSFWHQFLLDSRPFENCVFITQGGQRYSTHKLLAAQHRFLKELLLTREETEDESVLLLPEYTLEEVEEAMHFILVQSNTEKKGCG